MALAAAFGALETAASVLGAEAEQAASVATLIAGIALRRRWETFMGICLIYAVIRQAKYSWRETTRA